MVSLASEHDARPILSDAFPIQSNMKINISWVFGNFKVSASTEVETAEPVGSMAVSLLEAGFLQILQRVPSSRAEKHLAGYEKRPEKFSRASLGYSEENALKLAEGFGTEVEIAEGVKLKYAITDVVEHEGSEAGTSRKMATEMAEQVKGNVAMLTVLGCNGDSSHETIVEACHKFLGGLRKKKS